MIDQNSRDAKRPPTLHRDRLHASAMAVWEYLEALRFPPVVCTTVGQIQALLRAREELIPIGRPRNGRSQYQASVRRIRHALQAVARDSARYAAVRQWFAASERYDQRRFISAMVVIALPAPVIARLTGAPSTTIHARAKRQGSRLDRVWWGRCGRCA